MRSRFRRLALAAAAPLLGACVTVPPKPDLPSSIPAAVKSLKLRVASVDEGGYGDLAQPLRTAFELVLTDVGMTPTSDPGIADANLVAQIDEPSWAFNTYATHLFMRGDGGKLIDQFDFTGGSVGDNMHRTPPVFKKIAESVATNLLAQLWVSPKVQAYAAQRAKTRPVASAGGTVDKAAMKALMVESLKEVSASGKAAETAPDAIVSDVDTPKFKAPENSKNFAVVVGVEKYANELPEARFAERDAKAVKDSLVALGFPERNIKLLAGSRAVRSALEAYLEDWLPKNVKEDATVVFYFSGHGSPNTDSGEAYLVPWDGDPSFLDKTGYPLKKLYGDLNALKAKRVVVALDSCFSGAGGRSVLPQGTRPLVSKVALGDSAGVGKLVVLTASAGNQISGTFDAQGHGLFTYYLLRGLNGPAASADGSVTVRGLFDYLSPKVEDEASRANRGQSPQMLVGAGIPDLRLR